MKIRKHIFPRTFVSAGSRLDSRTSRESNRRPGRPGEGQGGPNKGHLDLKIGQNLRPFFFQTGLQQKPVCGDPCCGIRGDSSMFPFSSSNGGTALRIMYLGDSRTGNYLERERGTRPITLSIMTRSRTRMRSEKARTGI